MSDPDGCFVYFFGWTKSKQVERDLRMSEMFLLRGKRTKRAIRSVHAIVAAMVLPFAIGCGSSSKTSQTAQTPPPGYYPYPQQPYPNQPSYPYPNQQPYPNQAPNVGPQPGPTGPVAVPTQRPLLPPLFGAEAWQSEVRTVLSELIANLNADQGGRVRTIPLVFDPNPNDINAFAGCKQGVPFLAGTEGLLEAVDAISQTRASDEMFGTRTYDAYTNVVIPRLITPQGGSALLPAGIIPAQFLNDPRRLSRAHEIFDEVVAFTFGHELAHHYLDHTGCARGQSALPTGLIQLGQIATAVAPGLNQLNESAADDAAVMNVLDTGRARRARGAYPWTEGGGLLLLDFFGRLDRAAGISPLNPIGFLRTHPNPVFRVPLVQTRVQNWRMQHPGG